MKTQIKKLFNDSLIYGISGVISSLISIFLVPLYTKVFQPADYGVISLLTTTSVFLNIFLIFSFDNSAAILFWDKSDEHERKITFNTWFWFLAVVAIIMALFIITASKSLSMLFFSTDQYTLLFVLLGSNLIFAGFQKIVNIWCRMLEQPLKAITFSLFILFITVGLNILFVLVWKIGVIGVFLSQLIASGGGFLLMIFIFRSWIGIHFFSKIRLKEMLRLSIPLVPAAILFWLMNAASVYFLKIYTKDNAEVGLFQVGSSIANVLNLVTWAFFQAWSPFALSVSKQENAKNIYRVIFELYCVVGFFIALSLSLVGHDILTFFTNHNYLEAQSILGLLAVNVILVGAPNILSIANSLSKQNTPYAVAVGLGSAVTVILFYFLIPQYQKEGAAISMVVGNIFILLYLGYRAQQLYYIPYNFIRIVFIILLQLLLFYLCTIIKGTLPLNIFLIFAIGIVLCTLYYFTGVRNALSSFMQRKN